MPDKVIGQVNFIQILHEDCVIITVDLLKNTISGNLDFNQNQVKSNSISLTYQNYDSLIRHLQLFDKEQKIKVELNIFPNSAMSSCKACSEGNGCGALFYSKLSLSDGKLKSIKQILTLDDFIDLDLISNNKMVFIVFENRLYLKAVFLFYVLPLLFIVLVCLILSIYSYNINELIQIFAILSVLCLYFICIKKLLKNQVNTLKNSFIIKKYNYGINCM